MIERMRETFRGLPDVRKGGNNQRYTLEDAALGAFAVFFTQSPSFLDYQVRMRKQRGGDNAKSLFGIERIPCDQQIRNLLDPVAPECLYPLLMGTVEALYRLGELETHRVLAERFLVALDGTQYFSSAALSCPGCSTRKLANGTIQHVHAVVTPVLVAPGQAAVFPLPPEFIVPQDGHDKQDCELAAGTRWLRQWGARIAPWNVTFLGDDLYCHQPFCQQVLAHGGQFLFVCLPQSHPTLYEWVADFQRNGDVPAVVQTRWNGKQRLTDTYRYLNQLPLRDSDDALLVDWCELTTTDANGKVLYRNAWASSHPIGAATVVAIAAAGRSRWKIENENNNTLKTKGDHVEHNYGHGEQHLSAVLATLILLAFLLHTVLDRLDRRYRAVRAQLPSRYTFFEHLRALVQYLPFETWDALFDFMLAALVSAPPKAKIRPKTG
ncbi:MAG: ISNCY family transposase [Kiritimatiellia bacterium]